MYYPQQLTKCFWELTYFYIYYFKKYGLCEFIIFGQVGHLTHMSVVLTITHVEVQIVI